MFEMRRAIHLLFLLAAATGCASAEDPELVGSPTADTSVVSEAGPGSDSSAAPDTAKGEDSAPPAEDTSLPDATAEDTSAAMDTEPPADTATPPTDTGMPVMCGPMGSYGPKCTNTAECVALTGCGYICCGFDPFSGMNLGCGRSSPFPGGCLP